VRVEFEGWVFDSDRRQLLHASEAVPLSPKAFELLGALIRRRPAAISKAELKDVLWPSTFVADANLPSLVAEIRTSLRDNARQPRFVRTVQRFGYSFCAAATARTGAEESPASPVHPFRLVGNGHDVALPDGETVLGRSPELGGVVDSASVSRRHARIRVSGSGATIEDLASKNGTFVGGRRIRAPTALTEGDEIRLGTVKLIFRSAEGASTLTVSGSRD
jgi:DNA-binding winged helix-turn-helix (wHTH) protein